MAATSAWQWLCPSPLQRPLKPRKPPRRVPQRQESRTFRRSRRSELPTRAPHGYCSTPGARMGQFRMASCIATASLPITARLLSPTAPQAKPSIVIAQTASRSGAMRPRKRSQRRLLQVQTSRPHPTVTYVRPTRSRGGNIGKRVHLQRQPRQRTLSPGRAHGARAACHFSRKGARTEKLTAKRKRLAQVSCHRGVAAARPARHRQLSSWRLNIYGVVNVRPSTHASFNGVICSHWQLP